MRVNNSSDIDVLILLHVYNEKEMIEKCLKSLQSQDANFLCLISDNLSTDGTKDFIQKFVQQNSSNFLLFEPELHLDIASHWHFLYKQSQAKYDYIPYRMVFAGDDELPSNNYLSNLILSLEKDSKADIALPTFIFNDNFRSTQVAIKIKLSMRSRLLRVVKLTIFPTRLGYHNFVLGLMRKECFNLWADTFAKLIVFSPQLGRPKSAELVAMYRTLWHNRPVHNPDSSYVKNIHNPGRSDRILGLYDSTLTVKKKSNSKITFERQLDFSLSLLKATRRFRKFLPWPNFLYLYLLGALWFFVQVCDLVSMKIKKFLS